MLPCLSANVKRKALERIMLDAAAYTDGCLVEKYRKCGKPGCKCAQGEPDGPSLHLPPGRWKDPVRLRAGRQGRSGKGAGRKAYEAAQGKNADPEDQPRSRWDLRLGR